MLVAMLVVFSPVIVAWALDELWFARERRHSARHNTGWGEL